jgi:hypothetical protein
MSMAQNNKSHPVLIQFDLSKVDINKVFEIERLLHKIGVHFDTGAGFGFRDWNWDYSLTGPVSVTSLAEDDD